MDKFDQPELHPRGFPLWVEILLVSALILAPVVVVAVWQAWQDHQEKHTEGTPHSTVVETETKTPDATSTAGSAETKPASTETKSDTPETKPAATNNESDAADTKSDTTAGSGTDKPSPAETKTSP